MLEADPEWHDGDVLVCSADGRTPEGDPDYEAAMEIGRLLAERGRHVRATQKYKCRMTSCDLSLGSLPPPIFFCPSSRFAFRLAQTIRKSSPLANLRYVHLNKNLTGANN